MQNKKRSTTSFADRVMRSVSGLALGVSAVAFTGGALSTVVDGSGPNNNLEVTLQQAAPADAALA